MGAAFGGAMVAGNKSIIPQKVTSGIFGSTLPALD